MSGAFQFHPGVRKRWLKLHERWMILSYALTLAEWLFIELPIREKRAIG